MHSPNLYRVIQIKLKQIVSSGYELEIPMDVLDDQYYERMSDNSIFGQVRRITGKEWGREHKIEELVIVEFGTQAKKEEVVKEIVCSGFLFNNQSWLCCERSSSMKRNGFISFARSDIFFKLDEALTMGIDLTAPVVYSRYSSYRGLFFSGGHLIGG